MAMRLGPRVASGDDRQPGSGVRARSVRLPLRCVPLPDGDLLEQGVHHLGFLNMPDNLAVAEDDPLTVAGGDPDVGLTSFPGPVHHTAEDADFDRRFLAFKTLLKVGD